MSSSSFQTLQRLPVISTLLADLETPLSVYLKLAKGRYSYLFESVLGGEQWGRYSIIGLPCHTLLRIKGYQIEIEQNGKIIDAFEHADPLAYIEQYQQQYQVTEIEDLPRFAGGLVGYFGYDTIGYIEPKLAHFDKTDPLDNEDILLLVSEEVVVFDNLQGKLYLIVYADPAQPEYIQKAEARLLEIQQQLSQPVPINPFESTTQIKEADFVSGFTESGYKKAVNRIKDYIVEGDCMQVVISQRLSIPFNAPPLDLYRALRQVNPSPYLYFLDLGDFQIVGSSPEILTRLEDDMITVRPIAGTRRRGHSVEEDLAFEKELLSDPKELAEHLMLIDLGRNDAGRVSEIGEVKLTDKMLIERYSHVMHIVSNVTGKLKKGLSAMDVLRATFPAGTVSGAPKIRAMQIIDELEPVKRGVYAGAVGYLSFNGNMDTAIAIRTAVIKNKQLHIQAGAGVVADSQPELEWKETMNKARAIFKAAEIAEAGIHQASRIGVKQ